jgi:leukotriene-A4 hydrolase
MNFTQTLSSAAIVLFFLSTCKNPDKISVSPTEVLAKSSFDNHSYSNLNQVRTKHLHLELDINFENKTIYGVARHEMENFGADTAIFDISGLEIQKITLGKGVEKETDFMIGQWDKDSVLGQPLLVNITKKTKYINIYYKTTDKSTALEWLTPSMTVGKKLPYLFTQGQTILTRSWIPIQDSPSNRFTYSADVKVPPSLMAVMSAENSKEKSADGKYHFTMPKPIPCYLIALVVGDLVYNKLDEGCGLYTEPKMVQSCKYEFAELPEMVKVADSLFGKYEWGQYDVLVLPYSFPYGGMENPRLTFVTPTILAGDRSLVNVLAHELAHSWSGNLVTNNSWNDMWLNEGITTYFENEIIEAMHGKDMADMVALIDFQNLTPLLKEIAASKYPQDSRLKLKITDRNPDDVLNEISYVKGEFFFKTLEQKVGRVAMNAFFKAYINHFAFKTVNTEQFIEFLNKELLIPNKVAFNTNEWVYQEGIPSNCMKIRSPRLDEMKSLAQRVAAGEDIFKKEVKWVKVPGRKKRIKQVKQLKRSNYITQEWQTFIRYLPQECELALLRKIDRNLDFKDWNNAEVASEWMVLGIKNGYTEIRPQMKRFLLKTGRCKFLVPIYTELAKNPETKKWAKEVAQKAMPAYHPVAVNKVTQLLK